MLQSQPLDDFLTHLTMNWHRNHHHHYNQHQLPIGNLFSSSLVSSSTSRSTSTSTLTSMTTTTTSSSSSSSSSLESLPPYEWNSSAHSLSSFLEETNDPQWVESEWNRLVAENPKDLVCLLSRAGIFLRASGSSHQISGIRADQLVGLNITHLIHVNDLPAFYDHLNRAANEGKISTLSHLLRSKNLPANCYVQVVSTLSLYSYENNAVVGESPCILMVAKLSETNERFFPNCPVSEEDSLASTTESRMLEDLRHEAAQLRKQLEARQVELEALRKERDDQPGVKKKKRRQAMDLKCEECGTTESPEWRKGPSGTQSLCNACGLRYSKRLKKRAYFTSRENTTKEGPQ